MKSPSAMRIIQIELTNACPKRCANCTRFCGHQVKPFFMDFETFKKAVDSMKGFHGVVGIMGGEPTIHPEFERFVKYYRDTLGYDDHTGRAVRPVSNFLQHILGTRFDRENNNHRGLWSNINRKYYDHFELIQDTFGYQVLNDHSSPSMHETLMATRQELGIPDDEWIKLRDQCWIQNLWSASITPKGAFFCEVAAAMDMTLGGPGGWPIEPGWWKRTPAEFGTQLKWCEMCSAALPMPSRNANEEIDDVSPFWQEKLTQIESPKAKKGQIAVFDPASYRAGEYKVIAEAQPYLGDNANRIGSALAVLHPQKIASVVWLTAAKKTDEATTLLRKLQQAERLDYVFAEQAETVEAARALGVAAQQLTGWNSRQVLQTLREVVQPTDWILVTRDGQAPEYLWEAFQHSVFNPGTLHRLPRENGCRGGWFFNVRASALQKPIVDGTLEEQFSADKQVELTQNNFHDKLPSLAARALRRLSRIALRLTHPGC